MLGSGRLIDHSALFQNLCPNTTVSLISGQKIDTTVSVLVIVPVDKLFALLPCLLQVLKAFRLVIAVVFQCLEQALGIGIIVADPWPAVGWCDAQVIKSFQHGCAFHGTSVV